jgi:diguanylate cyclase (GGDEF)-like protein
MYEQPGRASYWLLTAVSGQPAADSGSGGESGTGMSTGMYLNTDIWLRGARDERTDLTTGIPGRNALLEILLRDWSAARRDQRRLSVLVFRIDALESYHSLFGRHATDACLRKVAHAIANSLQRAADFCARVGHDRFAVLVGDTDEERAAQFAERIAQRVRDLAIHHPRSQLARYVTVSWSIASEVPRPGAEEPCLLEEAESHVTGRAAPAPTADSTVQSAGSPASR